MKQKSKHSFKNPCTYSPRFSDPLQIHKFHTKKNITWSWTPLLLTQITKICNKSRFRTNSVNATTVLRVSERKWSLVQRWLVMGWAYSFRIWGCLCYCKSRLCSVIMEYFTNLCYHEFCPQQIHVQQWLTVLIKGCSVMHDLGISFVMFGFIMQLTDFSHAIDSWYFTSKGIET